MSKIRDEEFENSLIYRRHDTRSFILTRHFNYTSDVIARYWTNPKEFLGWAPPPYVDPKLYKHTVDVGKTARFVHHWDGVPKAIEYRCVAHERYTMLQYVTYDTEVWDENADGVLKNDLTITFEDTFDVWERSQTLLTLRINYTELEGRSNGFELDKFRDWKHAIDRLVEIVSSDESRKNAHNLYQELIVPPSEQPLR